jgi:hypothetical protein
MASIAAHLCSGIDCDVCIAAERVETTNRMETHKMNKFRKPAAKRSVTLSAKTPRQRELVAEALAVGFEDGYNDASTPSLPEPDNTLCLNDMTGRLNTPEDALRFILAGNAYFTVRSLKTNVRYTFRVNRADCSRCGKNDCHCWAHPQYFVALLSGPDNGADYSYMGMIRDNVLRTTRASKMREDSVPFKAFRYVLQHLITKRMPPQTEIWHDGRCGRCGRHLTVPSSVAAGLGPECAGKEL